MQHLLFSKHYSKKCGHSGNEADKGLEAGECRLLWSREWGYAEMGSERQAGLSAKDSGEGTAQLKTLVFIV